MFAKLMWFLLPQVINMVLEIIHHSDTYISWIKASQNIWAEASIPPSLEKAEPCACRKDTAHKLRHRQCTQHNELLGETIFLLFGLWSIYFITLHFAVWPSLMYWRSHLGIQNDNFSPTSLEQLTVMCNAAIIYNVALG